jgi:NhaP-type Na+/H+ or K+/H+ antiporter
VSALAKVAEALLFFLLGAFIFGIQINQESDKSVDYTFSWSLLLITIFSLLVARFINVYLMSLIGYLVVGADKWRLNAYEYNILFVSGLVKGAIPFALVLTLPTANHKFTTASIQNTVIVIVFFTSLFLNSLMPKFLRFMLNKIDQMIKTHQNHPSLYDSLLI